MLGFLWWKGNPVSGSQLAELLQQAQAGDGEARDAMVRSYADWALRVAARHCGRYLHAESDDEASIALLALDEAVLTYQPNSGSQFPSFAAMVIKRRLIDYHRREARHPQLPLSALNWSEEVRDEADDERRQRSEEIAAFVTEMSGYGLTLQQLVQSVPKQRDARQRAMEVASIIANSPALYQAFSSYRELPLKQLVPLVSVSRKTLERQRKYIAAMTIILAGEYEFLQTYLNQNRGVGQIEEAGLGVRSGVT